jgi:DNA-binding transcriptional LysR family regulator
VGTARGLRVKPFARPAPGRTIGAVWRKSTTRTPAITGIVATIRSTMKDGTKK